ncbi:cell wall hydrolase [Altererythrobacter sp. KTW20L]|uniref:cell wall hydrolase n=1 Tax=Altererythrobacter sp. KTW20L TaxID=2942210 RepID=UPI0020BE469D|nr:cell wall hydrolase [Altererythrobacter sp. KTW20L]MCL6251738.1 cell wall hydrolase [Altererythrobacter sp. KTW20L]
MTRVGRAQGLTSRTRRRIVFKRVGVLAAAIAVPAMAAPPIQQAEPQVIRFVLPDTIPWVPTPVAQADNAAVVAEPAVLPAALADPGPSARPFAALLGYADRARAQECLAMAVYYEAASESLDGQRAVAQVVMNRVRHPSWPASVCGVVFQGAERTTGCQFSFTCDGSLNRKPQASAMARAHVVARAALGGYVHDGVGLATHYHTTDIYPYWAPSLKTVATIGLHRFYRGNGAGGGPGAFSAVYAGNESGPVRHYASAAVEPVARAEAPLAASYQHATYSPAAQAMQVAVTEPAPVQPAQQVIRPQSGQVLEQHARSGQWLQQP